jgi:hypothetical protein
MKPTCTATLVPRSHVPERRQWYRYPCGPLLYCRLIISGVIDFWASRVHNLSTGGIKLIADIRIPRGTVLTVVLHNPARRYSCQRQVRIAYSHKVGKIQFIVGGGFLTELGVQEMNELL